MAVWFISDPHLGHKNIPKYRPWVSSVEDNTNKIVNLWHTTVRKNDMVYVLGDAAFDDQSLEMLGNLKGRKILIKGNHDDFVSTKLQSQVFEEIHGIIKYKAMWLSHAPIHPAELRGKCNAHGHVHAKSVRTWYGSLDKRYHNTCVDVIYPKTGNVFVNLETIKSYFGLSK